MDFERPTPNSARARRAYLQAPEKLIAAIEKAVERLPSWTLEQNVDGVLHATRKTGLLRFVDDIEVRVLEWGNGSEVHFESSSRVGKGDLGQNPRNLRELLKTVNQELGQSSEQLQ